MKLRARRAYWGAIVAPHWGAWIEILTVAPFSTICESHPTGVRGLKFAGYAEQRGGDGRTPLGCVD